MFVAVHRVISGPDGTFGVMTIGDKPVCVTCENPWFNNQRNISCIPNGVYACVPHTGTKYKNVWRLEDVPGRAGILIHHGNTEKDTYGCILVGNSYADFKGVPGIANSVATLDMLRRRLPPKFTLRITGPAALDGLHLTS